MDIKINIKNKIAELAEPARIVCGNSDYTAVFSFDEEWAQYQTKTARFMHGGSYTDVVFTGNRCPMPVMRGVTGVYIGVYAGDLHTSTPAYISCDKSILCDGGAPVEPTPDVYAQIMEVLAHLGKGGTEVTIDGEAVATFPADTYTKALLAKLVDSAPETLDTLAELAKALGNDPNFATTITTELGKKLDAQNVPYTVYGVAGWGVQTYYNLSTVPRANTIAQRNEDGTLYVERATHELGAVNLKQLNEMLAEQVGDISTALDTLHEYAQALVNGGAN